MYNNPQLVLDEIDDESVDEPNEDELKEYAQAIGIDVVNEPQLVWVARAGITAPLPAGWKPVQTNDDDVYFYNFATNQSTWEHPSDDKYRQMVREERKKLELRGKARNLSPLRLIGSIGMRNEPHFGQEDVPGPSIPRGSNRLAALQRTKPKPVMDFSAQNTIDDGVNDTKIEKKPGPARPKTSRGNQRQNKDPPEPAFALRKGGSKFLKGAENETENLVKSMSQQSEDDFSKPPDILKLHRDSSESESESKGRSMHLNLGGTHIILDPLTIESPKKSLESVNTPKIPESLKIVKPVKPLLNEETMEENRFAAAEQLLHEEYETKLKDLENSLDGEFERRKRELMHVQETNLQTLRNSFETELKSLKTNHDSAVKKMKEGHVKELGNLKKGHEKSLAKEVQDMQIKIQNLRKEHNNQLAQLESVEGIEKELEEKKMDLQEQIVEMDAKKKDVHSRYEKEMADTEAEWETALAKCKMQWKNKIAKLEAENKEKFELLQQSANVEASNEDVDLKDDAIDHNIDNESLRRELDILRSEIDKIRGVGSQLNETVHSLQLERREKQKKPSLKESSSSSDYPRDPSSSKRVATNDQETIQETDLPVPPITIPATSVYISNGMSVPEAIHQRLNELQSELSNLTQEIQTAGHRNANENLNTVSILNPDFVDKLIDQRWAEFQRNGPNAFPYYPSKRTKPKNVDYNQKLEELKTWIHDFEKRSLGNPFM